MMVVKVEIWPGGYAPGAYEIARLGIANRGGGTPEVADYDILALLGRERRETVCYSEVLRHQRDYGWESLVMRAIELEGKPLPLDERARVLAEVLRRG